MDGNHSASVAATASLKEGKKKKGNKVSEREGWRERERERRLASPLLISANGFCRARRELYALIMQWGKKRRDWACEVES